MRTHGSARRSRAIWSRRRVSSFSRASKRLALGEPSVPRHDGMVPGGHFDAVFLCSVSDGARRGPFRSAAAAIEEVGAVGLEPADAGAARHLEPLEHGAALRVDAADLALVAFPGAVPQLAVDPGHAGDEAVGLDGANDRAGLGIDLVDLAIAVLPDPQAALGPGEPRVAAVAGRRDRRHHVAGGGIDLVDARLGDLIEVLAVEGGAGVAGALERARGLAARGIEGDAAWPRWRPRRGGRRG